MESFSEKHWSYWKSVFDRKLYSWRSAVLGECALEGTELHPEYKYTTTEICLMRKVLLITGEVFWETYILRKNVYFAWSLKIEGEFEIVRRKSLEQDSSGCEFTLFRWFCGKKRTWNLLEPYEQPIVISGCRDCDRVFKWYQSFVHFNILRHLSRFY